MEAHRIIIHAQDVQALTGRSLRYAQNLLKDIRKKENKGKNHLVTISEFCSYCQFNLDEVLKGFKK